MMKNLHRSLIVFLLLTPVLAQSKQADYGREARMAFESFKCSVYASYMGDADLSRGHFDQGATAGRTFISAVVAGNVTDNEARSSVPIFINQVMSSGGPSADFFLGRIYDQSSVMASDDVIKKDTSGLLLPHNEWRFDKELQKNRAESLYNTANCWVLEKKQ